MMTLLESLDDEDRGALEEALAGPTTGEAIARVLQASGYHMAGATVQRHRRGNCMCEAK